MIINSLHMLKIYTDTGQKTKNKETVKENIKRHYKNADVQGKEKMNGTKEREQFLW